jgi:hypothetical protein
MTPRYWLAATLAVVACTTVHAPEIDPRFLAVHNTLSAMGLAQVGPVQQGSLVEGREARLPMELTAQCTTLVTMGGEGVRDLDAELVDPHGNTVAKDATHESQAVLRACVESAGTYTLVVKMAAGSGDFLTAMWSGGSLSGGAPTAGGTAAMAGTGTCDSPIVIGPGTYQGNTARGESQNEGQCSQRPSKEIVYRIEIPTQKRIVVDTETTFDGVLYMRKEHCDVQDAEVACNDDADSNARASKIDIVVDPGTYFIFVDGYDNGTGTYRLNVAMNDVPSIADVCRNARVLPIGSTVTGSTTSAFDLAHASCGEDAKGKEVTYRFDLAQRSRVRIIEHSDDYAPVVYVRRTCTDEQSEVSCSDTSGADNEAAFVQVLDPGSYAVFADSSNESSDGHFTVAAETAPEQGSGVQGDGCSDAEVLNKSDPAVAGDTFFAKDDVAGRCGGTGAADMVYRVDLPRKSRVIASMGQQDGEHLFILQKTCGDKTSELSCGDSLDKVLPAGTYYVAVDGKTPDSFGKFTFDFELKDVGSQENACKAAAPITDGQTINSTTTGAGHKFTTSCGGSEPSQGSPDKLYKLTVTGRTHVRLSLATPTWDGVLAVRKSCLEPEGSNGARYAEVSSGCNNDSTDSHHSLVDTWLEAGTYFVVVSGHMTGNEGQFTLDYHTVK